MTRYLVTVVRVKPDMLTEWVDLQKNEVAPAQKKGGVKSRTVWATSVGNAFEYTIITPFDKWALMDSPNPVVTALGAEAAARLNAKVRKCIESQRSYLTNRVDEFDIPAGDALVMRSTVRRVPAGKMQDYLSYHRTDVLPAQKKAKADGKIAGAGVAVRGVGAQANELATTTYYSKFADMDGGNPVAAAVGQEAAAKIGAKGDAIATTIQTVVRRRMADLSF